MSVSQADVLNSLTGPSAYFFGFMGAASALVFANLGTAYGTAKAGVGILSMGVLNPGLAMKNIIPVIMAGVFGIYGLIVAILIADTITSPAEPTAVDGGFAACASATDCYTYASAFRGLASGLCCGISGLAAGMAIGIVGDAGVRAVGQQERMYVVMILILIFAEALALYGLIVALVLSQG